MERFSLQTFIKICLLDTNGRIGEIRKKLDPKGGYDYYNSFYRATRSFCGDRDLVSAKQLFDPLAKDAERKHNLAGFEAFLTKFGASKTLEAVSENRKYSPPGSLFEISVDPLFSVEKSGLRYAYLPWLTQNPDMNQKYAAVALYIARQAYKGTSLGNYQFIFFDFTKRRAYSEAQITDNTKLVLQSDSKMISDLIVEL